MSWSINIFFCCFVCLIIHSFIAFSVREKKLWSVRLFMFVLFISFLNALVPSMSFWVCESESEKNAKNDQMTFEFIRMINAAHWPKCAFVSKIWFCLNVHTCLRLISSLQESLKKIISNIIWTALHVFPWDSTATQLQMDYICHVKSIEHRHHLRLNLDYFAH